MSTAGNLLKADHRTIDDGFEAFIAVAQGGHVDASVVIDTIDGLRRHIWIEEDFLFPPLREAGMVGPVLVMLREHGEIWDGLTELERLLAQSDIDPEAALTVCAALSQTLEQHNLKEETILYETADRLLDPAVHEVITQRMTDELPPGWTCEMATT